MSVYPNLPSPSLHLMSTRRLALLQQLFVSASKFGLLDGNDGDERKNAT